MKSILLPCVVAVLGLTPLCQAQSWSLDYGNENGKVAYYNSSNTPDFAEDSPYGPLSFRVKGDNIWVLDSIAGKLSLFDKDSKLVKSIVVPGLEGFRLLEDFALVGNDPLNPEAVWIANAADVSIKKISLENGSLISRLEGDGTDNGRFGQIHQLEVDAGGRLYVADIAKSKISVFSATGSFLREYPWQSSGMFVDKQANLHLLYYSEKGGYFHQIYSSKGQLIANRHLGFNKNTNGKIIHVASDGSIILQMIPEEGFKGVLKLVKIDAFGVTKESLEFVPPTSMNRYVNVDKEKVFIAEADYETAPNTKFMVKPHKWAEKKEEGAK